MAGKDWEQVLRENLEKIVGSHTEANEIATRYSAEKDALAHKAEENQRKAQQTQTETPKSE